MQLLARSLKSAAQLFAHTGWFTLLLGGVLLGLELAGRHTSNDWQDAVLASALGVLLAITAYRHHKAPLPWLRPVMGAARAAGAWLKQWLVEIGYDLRGEPRVRRGCPPVLLALGAIFAAWGGLLLLLGDFFPDVLRVAGVRYFYLGYLAGMMLLWGGLILIATLSMWIAVGLVHDELTADADLREYRGPSRAGLFMGLVASMMLASRLIPLWYVLVACVTAWLGLTALALFGGRSDVHFLWRPRGTTRVRSLTAAESSAMLFGLAVLFALNLSVTAAGSHVWKDPLVSRTPMPFTVMLGSVLGWVLLALLAVFVWHSLRERLRSPARTVRRVLHVRGGLPAEARRVLRRHFPRRAWRLDADPSPADPCAAVIEIVDPALSQAREFDPGWPLKLALADLDDPAVVDRIARRSDIQVRRRLLGGLERLFKIAKRRKYRNGHGYWVAPHLQLWNGLRRDEPEPEPGPLDTHMVHDNVGPAYHRVFPQLARHLAYVTMRSLHLDLIFVEDAVPYRKLAKVMRRLFELHDKQPGRPAEDAHFGGLIGTKAIVHEFQFDNEYESETYPEPKFTTLGRARILLVFRDREEHEERVEPPFDFSHTPAPLGLRG